MFPSAAGLGRKHAILVRCPEVRKTAVRPFSLSSCAARPSPLRQPPPLPKAPSRFRATICQPALERKPTQNRNEKRRKAALFPAVERQIFRFAARKFRLCGKKFFSFSKEIQSLPRQNTRFCAKNPPVFRIPLKNPHIPRPISCLFPTFAVLKTLPFLPFWQSARKPEPITPNVKYSIKINIFYLRKRT